MKKTFLILFIICFIITGCTPNVEKEEITFTGLDDGNLQNYVIENLYSGMNSEFSNEDYTIQEITATYISKEYLEELEYNSKSNIYFGFTQDELSKMFNGKKYVFNVGEDNKTVVQEFQFYNDNYYKIIRNVLIGSGVIVICATVSVVSGGTIAIIFAASAKTAASFAVSSSALSGLMSTAFEYYETGDFKKALEKGMLEASESFKWGAIIGAFTGGIGEASTQFKAAKDLKSMNFQERGARAELRAAKKYGGREQVSYLNGQEVNSSVPGATKPDLTRNINGKLEAIEVKNYNLNSEISRENLLKELDRQVTSRSINLPKGSTQRIVLDIQGRNYNKSLLNKVINDIKKTCEHSYHNIPVDVMS